MHSVIIISALWKQYCTAVSLKVAYTPPPVLQEYCKLNDQMEHKEYYSALKTLELLEHTYLPRVRGYIFSELLSTEIPKIRESIQGQSRAELTVSSYYCNHYVIHTIMLAKLTLVQPVSCT